jgi:hypothetical protein
MRFRPVLLVLLWPGFAHAVPERPEFNRHVRPILADHCFNCHGFDPKTRKAELRLDTREGALADLGGHRAVVPGRPEESELWKRVTHTDPDEVMPPPEHPKDLTAAQREVLRRWIEQGAEYQDHWAYIPVRRPEIPAPAGHPVDAFLSARQHEAGLVPAPEADRATLARRLYFDLTGLPPTPAEIAAFAADAAPDAVERLVDRLLASPAFGERLAAWWLDQVRYADSIGYHSDNPRNVWPYRDYVIRAFNANLPFDRFTVEQLAGDLLPDATTEQKVASGYNRLILTTEEGGAQAKEYEAKHVTDRVKSIGTTFLAQTFLCAECHDHKYDPVSTRDFYALGAFFADIQEASIGRREEGMVVASPEQESQRQALQARVAAAEAALKEKSSALASEQAAWEASLLERVAQVNAWTPVPAVEVHSQGGNTLVIEEDRVRLSDVSRAERDVFTLTFRTSAPRITGLRVEALLNPNRSVGLASNGNFVLSELTLESVDAGGARTPLAFSFASATHEQNSFPAAHAIDGNRQGGNNGWAVLNEQKKEQALYLELAQPWEGPGEKTLVLTRHELWGSQHFLGNMRLSITGAPAPIRAPGAELAPTDVLAALKVTPEQRKAKQLEKIAAHFRSIAPALAGVRQELEAAQKELKSFEAQLPRSLVSVSGKPRVVRVLPRGNWQDTSGEVVLPATPDFLPGRRASTEAARLTRLDLAHWLLTPENPLTARVVVNRLWKMFYGEGLVKTLEDLGTQSEPPELPDLLDWLADDFRAGGWDVKRLVRTLVTSAAYRRSSLPTELASARDPGNRIFSHQGRWRLEAEMVRDQALAVSGLLVRKIGGPSVHPYQPDGYWENLNFPTRSWPASKGEDQWRRGLYTWWQRSYLHPSMLAFDAPTREECAPDRLRSNIPQQALALLNDPSYVEAARALAARLLREGGATPEERARWGFREVTGRVACDEEVAILTGIAAKHQAEYAADLPAAQALLKVGQHTGAADLDPAELAGWTSVARALLNLHETITRR